MASEATFIPAAFANCVQLPHKIGVIIPSEVKGIIVDPAATARKIAAKFAGIFGGATQQNARGVWLSDERGTVREDNVIVYSNCTRAGLEEHARAILKIARAIRAELSQDAIAVLIDDALILVED